MQTESTKQLKRRRPNTNYDDCIICQKGADTHSGSMQKLTDHGYPALLYAVTNRKDEVSFRLQNEVEPQSDFLQKNPVCHARCRSKYTNRKTVDHRKGKFAKHEDTSSKAGFPSESDSSVSITRSSTSQREKPCTSTNTIPYDAGLTQLLSRIDEPLFRDGAVFFVTVLRDEFHKYLENHGVGNAKSYRSQSLVARLQRHYEVDGICKIMVVPQKGCSSLICSANLSIGCMIAKLKQLKETAEEAQYEEESGDEVTPDDTIISSFNTAKRIRMELQDQRKVEKQALKDAKEDVTFSASGSQQVPKGESEMEVSYNEASQRVSCNLYNHLAWLITDASPEVGEDDRVHVNPKQHEQVLNLAQDVCRAVAFIPSPKHIGTALHILKETRSDFG